MTCAFLTTQQIEELAVVIELRQALTEQHNRMAARIAELSSGWQPISTAPMDGTPLMLFARAIRATAPVCVIGWHDHDMGWIDAVFCPNHSTRIVPTYWMALPSFPGAQAAIPRASMPAGFAHWIESATTLYAPDEDEEYDALGLSLLTDDQAAMTAERIEESHRLSCLADIFSTVPGL